MARYNPQQALDDICEATGCSREQVIDVVGRAFEALHKTAVCNEMSVTGAMGLCLDHFGSKACYHLVGLLEEARLCTRDEPDLPWSETYMRFAGQSWREFVPVVESWMQERSEERKLRDERRKSWAADLTEPPGLTPAVEPTAPVHKPNPYTKAEKDADVDRIKRWIQGKTRAGGTPG
jgi:hypothetical protein